MLENQGLLAIAFFEATAFIILLVLFLLFRRDHPASYFRLWITGWACLTIYSVLELGFAIRETPWLWLAAVLVRVTAALVLLMSVMQYTAGSGTRYRPLLPLMGVILAVTYYVERRGTLPFRVHWETAGLQAVVLLWAGWLLWRRAGGHKGHGAQLLAGAFVVSGLHGIDQPLWSSDLLFQLRVAFDHLLSVSIGVSMVVLVLEKDRARSEELNDKMRRLTLLTAASTQTLSVKEVLEQVLGHLVESLGATHGIVRLIEGDGDAAQFVPRASVGFRQSYLEKYGHLPLSDLGMKRVLERDFLFSRLEDQTDPGSRERVRKCRRL